MLNVKLDQTHFNWILHNLQ